MADAYFPPEMFAFLRDLKRHNDRDWFRANRDRYESDVKEPMLAFIAAFVAPLRKISPHFVADPRPVGGSLFRIHRDTRFAKDKSPYKTHASAQFRHERGKDVHAPGFYLHLEPDNVFLGAGIWRPDGPSLGRIRDAIVEDPGRWKRAVGAKAFREGWAISGESLKRPPRGYDPGHPLVEDLKRKDFIAVSELSERDACVPGFLRKVASGYRSTRPFVRFLTGALDLPA
jgi:uncharacterized protein (TIGR02453 family)